MDSEGLLAEPLDSHLLRLSGTDEENDGSGVSFEPFPSGTAEDVAMEERAEEDEAMENEKDVEGSGDEDDEDEDDSQVYCLCRQPDDGTFMISCDKCEEW